MKLILTVNIGQRNIWKFCYRVGRTKIKIIEKNGFN